jgi:hypothetical protein
MQKLKSPVWLVDHQRLFNWGTGLVDFHRSVEGWRILAATVHLSAAAGTVTSASGQERTACVAGRFPFFPQDRT